eukprot:516469-Hanusia_phi.AAC.3
MWGWPGGVKEERMSASCRVSVSSTLERKLSRNWSLPRSAMLRSEATVFMWSRSRLLKPPMGASR